MKRTLTLRTESLSELSFDELGLVAGAQPGPTVVPTCPLIECLNSYFIPCTVATR